MDKKVIRIDPAAMRALDNYDWPGNVRELESIIKQALINATGTVITSDCLPEVRCFKEGGGVCGEPEEDDIVPVSEVSVGNLPRHDLASFIESRLKASTEDLHAETLEMMERYLLTRVLRETGGNQSLAAKMLGITRGSLRNKIRSLRLSIDHVVTVSGVGAAGG
jgi:two-component system nitrogen regulation response regulator GlnG